MERLPPGMIIYHRFIGWAFVAGVRFYPISRFRFGFLAYCLSSFFGSHGERPDASQAGKAFPIEPAGTDSKEATTGINHK